MIESRNAENIFFKALTGVHTSGSRDHMHRRYVASSKIHKFMNMPMECDL